MQAPDPYQWCRVPPYLLPLFTEGWSHEGHHFVRRRRGWRREQQRVVMILRHDTSRLLVHVELDKDGRERDHATLTFPDGQTLYVMNAEAELADVIDDPPRDPDEARARFHSIKTGP